MNTMMRAMNIPVTVPDLSAVVETTICRAYASGAVNGYSNDRISDLIYCEPRDTQPHNTSTIYTIRSPALATVGGTAEVHRKSPPAGRLQVRPEALRCLLYTSPSPRDKRQSRMPSSA